MHIEGLSRPQQDPCFDNDRGLLCIDGLLLLVLVPLLWLQRRFSHCIVTLEKACGVWSVCDLDFSRHLVGLCSNARPTQVGSAVVVLCVPTCLILASSPHQAAVGVVPVPSPVSVHDTGEGRVVPTFVCAPQLLYGAPAAPQPHGVVALCSTSTRLSSHSLAWRGLNTRPACSLSPLFHTVRVFCGRVNNTNSTAEPALALLLLVVLLVAVTAWLQSLAKAPWRHQLVMVAAAILHGRWRQRLTSLATPLAW